VIRIEQVNKRFGAHAALVDATIEVPRGELLALLGPSGGGKTTLLRVIAGLEAPDTGRVVMNDVDVTRAGVHERGVGFVFQHFALFREMSVRENVAFGLRVRPRATRPTDAQILERVHKLLEMVQLEGLASRYPEQLSGGQRQRVALARALAVEPKVLLLDEPFGALDARVRRELRRFLRRLHDELGTTTILVTHDQEEAFEISDRVAVIHAGRIQQAASPSELVRAPANDVVRAFLADEGGLEGVVGSDGRIEITTERESAWSEGARVRVVPFSQRPPPPARS
jgi:sulfate transport system ATP-binding protein